MSNFPAEYGVEAKRLGFAKADYRFVKAINTYKSLIIQASRADDYLTKLNLQVELAKETHLWLDTVRVHVKNKNVHEWRWYWLFFLDCFLVCCCSDYDFSKLNLEKVLKG